MKSDRVLLGTFVLVLYIAALLLLGCGGGAHPAPINSEPGRATVPAPQIPPDAPVIVPPVPIDTEHTSQTYAPQVCADYIGSDGASHHDCIPLQLTVTE